MSSFWVGVLIGSSIAWIGLLAGALWGLVIFRLVNNE